jgi:hypothetical protein
MFDKETQLALWHLQEAARQAACEAVRKAVEASNKS